MGQADWLVDWVGNRLSYVLVGSMVGQKFVELRCSSPNSVFAMCLAGFKMSNAFKMSIPTNQPTPFRPVELGRTFYFGMGTASLDLSARSDTPQRM